MITDIIIWWTLVGFALFISNPKDSVDLDKLRSWRYITVCGPLIMFACSIMFIAKNYFGVPYYMWKHRE